MVARLVDAGMAALEVFHPDHAAQDVHRYETLARELNVVPTGGSDYHGPDTDRAPALGRIGPRSLDYARLLALRHERGHSR